MQPEIQIPPTEDLKAEGGVLVTTARALVIETKEQYAAAGEFLRKVARFKDEIVARFKEPKGLSNRLHKSIVEAENGFLEKPAEAERVVKGAMSVYLQKEERERRIEQARLQEEQRKQDEAARLAQAEALDKAGDTEAAIKVLDTPIAAAVVPMEKPKAAGVSSRSVWHFEVIDPELVKRRFLCPDLKKIQGVVDGMKLEADEVVGGIRVYEEKVIVARR